MDGIAGGKKSPTGTMLRNAKSERSFLGVLNLNYTETKKILKAHASVDSYQPLCTIPYSRRPTRYARVALCLQLGYRWFRSPRTLPMKPTQLNA